MHARLIGHLPVAALAATMALLGCTDRPAADPASYVGRYSFQHDPGEPSFEVTLLRSGEARSTANGPGTISRGTWSMAPDGARIRWNDGWKNELSHSKAGWTQRSWPPGRSFAASPMKEVPALRLDPPAEGG